MTANKVLADIKDGWVGNNYAQILAAEVERLRLELESASILENALYAQCDYNIQLAEAAEAEVEQLTSKLHNSETTLETFRGDYGRVLHCAKNAEAERDRYRNALEKQLELNVMMEKNPASVLRLIAREALAGNSLD